MPNSPDVPPLGPGAEFDLIRRILEDGAPARDDVRIGAGDDCAVVAGDGIVVGADMCVEGIHFRREWLEPEEIGYRGAAASLSDLAAMAARPIGIVVALAVRPADAAGAAATAVRVVRGARAAVNAVGGVLLGGDVTRSPGPMVLDVTVVGEAPEPVGRGGASPGDAVWVSGRLGAAAAAVASWHRGAEPPPMARAAFARPNPRVREARWLAERGLLCALIDLSDGLAGDASHLAAAGGVAVALRPDHVPVHPAAHAVAGDDPAGGLRLALAGGDDYELCFAAPADEVQPVRPEFEKRFDVALSRVGDVLEGDGVYLRRADGALEPLSLRGYRHFEGDAS